MSPGDDDFDVPDDVIAAAKRLENDEGLLEDIELVPTPTLADRHPRRTPNRPKVFREIIENDNEREAIHAKGTAMSQAEWRRLKELTDDRKQNLVPSAEKMLEWNTDKGDGPK